MQDRLFLFHEMVPWVVRLSSTSSCNIFVGIISTGVVSLCQEQTCCCEQGPVSISDKTSYCKILQNLEVARFVFRIVQSLWNLTSTSAVVLPKCLSNFKGIRKPKLPISRPRDQQLETSRDLTIRRLIGYWNRAQVEASPIFSGHVRVNQWSDFFRERYDFFRTSILEHLVVIL